LINLGVLYYFSHQYTVLVGRGLPYSKYYCGQNPPPRLDELQLMMALQDVQINKRSQFLALAAVQPFELLVAKVLGAVAVKMLEFSSHRSTSCPDHPMRSDRLS